MSRKGFMVRPGSRRLETTTSSTMVVSASVADGLQMGWPVAATPADYVLGHVRAVLPGRVLDDARIVVREGLVAEVGPHPVGVRADLDGQGLMCLPGLIDVHSDSLARECRPRPGASVPVDFALRSVEAALLAAGVTTAFHGVAFQQRSAVGITIDSPACDEVHREILHAQGRLDHRVLHRVDVRCPVGVARFRRTIESGSAVPPSTPALVSHEDHTPGQGQYADPEDMRRWLVEAESMSSERALAHVEWLTADRDARRDLADRTLGWLGKLAQAGRIRLAGHDLASLEEVEALARRGGAVAEFPTTMGAAEAAQTAGLLVVAGAPNVLRGSSHSGNVSARQLVAAGLVDALTSDYLPAALLAVVTELVRLGIASLQSAVRLVTSGPAAVVGLTDRGSLAAGQRADLVVADVSGRWPVICGTLTAPVR